MKHIVYEDATGRRWLRGLPEDRPDSEAEYGVPLGPPDLTSVVDAQGWTEDFAVAVHNQLADRELWGPAELRAKGGRQALNAALKAALRAEAHVLEALYAR